MSTKPEAKTQAKNTTNQSVANNPVEKKEKKTASSFTVPSLDLSALSKVYYCESPGRPTTTRKIKEAKKGKGRATCFTFLGGNMSSTQGSTASASATNDASSATTASAQSSNNQPPTKTEIIRSILRQ